MWFRKKKEKTLTEILEPEGTTQVGFTGRELIVNPPDSISLKRLKGRLKRVNIWLQKETSPSFPLKFERMKKTKKRLEMQIKLKEGDY